MADRTFPQYYKWEHPTVDIIVLVKMDEFAIGRFWERKLNDWGPVDMGDLCEQIDTGVPTMGVWFEEITEAEATELIATKLGPYDQS